MKILFFLKRNLSWVLPLTMIMAFLFGAIIPDISFLSKLILPFTIMMILPMMVTLNFQRLFKGNEKRLYFLALVINFLLIPVFAWLTGLLLLGNYPDLRIGLFLMALIPTSGMTISWTQFSEGNTKEAVKLSIAGILIGGALTPFYLKLFFSSDMEFPLSKIFTQLVLVLFIPLAAGLLIQLMLRKMKSDVFFDTRIKKNAGGFSIVGLLAIIFTATALKSRSIMANPAQLLLMLLPVMVFYLFGYLISSFAGKAFLSYENSIVLVYSSSLRNLSIALALAVAVFGSSGASVSLIISLAYILQVQSAAWYSKFSRKLLEKKVYGTELS